MVGWHRRLDGHEFEQALGVGEGQGGLACCGPWGGKESDPTERLKKQPAPRGESTRLSTSVVGGLQVVLLCIRSPVAFSLLSYQKGCSWVTHPGLRSFPLPSQGQRAFVRSEQLK